MTKVVDASIVIRLLAARAGDEPLRQRFSRVVHAPHLIDAEVSSVIRGLSITSKLEIKISERRAQEMMDDYAGLRIVRYPMLPYQRRVFALRGNFTSYDAFCVALAESLQIPLLTDDNKFSKAPAGVHEAVIQTYPELSEGSEGA